MESEPKHASVRKLIDLAADIDKWGRKQHAVLENSNDTIALPNKHSPIGREREPDRRKGREDRDQFRGESRVRERLRPGARSSETGEPEDNQSPE